MLLRSFIKISFVFLICSCVVIVDISFNKHVYCIKSDFEYKDCYNSTKLRFSYRTNTNDLTYALNGTMSVHV